MPPSKFEIWKDLGVRFGVPPKGSPEYEEKKRAYKAALRHYAQVPVVEHHCPCCSRRAPPPCDSDFSEDEEMHHVKPKPKKTKKKKTAPPTRRQMLLDSDFESDDDSGYKSTPVKSKNSKSTKSKK